MAKPRNHSGHLLPLALAVTVCAVSACSVPFPVYSVSAPNVQAIRALPATIRLGQITGSQTSASCRLQPIAPENDTTFASYIRKAFEDELVIANAPPHNKVVELSGTVKNVDVDCGIIDGDWTIDMAVSVNSQPPVEIKTVRRFDGNYAGVIVLNRAMTAFVPSVQQLIDDVLTSPAMLAAANAP
jgi:hypothetical protein